MSYINKRKLARKLKKSADKGNKKARRENREARQSVKQAYVNYYCWELETRRTALRNLSACFLYVMHKNYGFGRTRLLKLRDKMQSEFDSIVNRNVSVDEIVDFLRDELHVDIDVHKSGTKDRQRQIEERGVREMSAAFLMALLDEYGFKKKRLTDAYWYACELSDENKAGKITYAQIREKIEVVMNEKGRKGAGAGTMPGMRRQGERKAG